MAPKSGHQFLGIISIGSCDLLALRLGMWADWDRGVQDATDDTANALVTEDTAPKIRAPTQTLRRSPLGQDGRMIALMPNRGCVTA